MTLPNIRPRITDNPTCNDATLRRALEVLQEQCDAFANNLSVISPLTALWGKATRNWSSSTYDVTVNPCESDGGNVDIDTEHTVVFVNQGIKDPNVVVTQVIMYWFTADGTFATTDGLDEKVGVCRPIAQTGSATQGWAEIDSVNNSLANGGSGNSMESRFPRHTINSFEVGDTGGSASHTHDFQTDLGGDDSGNTGSSIIGFAITNTSVTGVTVGAHDSEDITDCIQDHTKAQVAATLADHTKAQVAQAIGDHPGDDIVAAIDDHDDHAHQITGTQNAAAGSDFSVAVDGDCTGAIEADNCSAAGGAEYQHNAVQDVNVSHSASANDDLAHGPHATNDPLEHNPVAMQTVTHSVTDIGHTHNLTDPGHSHAVTFPAHDHTGSTDAGSSLPPYLYLNWEERIDNSTEVTGT
ncbi:MAG: hypothetical protein RIC55_21485 [Pirellulaceae bacterium]